MKHNYVFLLAAVSFVFLSGCIINTQPPTTTLPEVVCNAPYIRFENRCCLDRNDNSICDRDEAEATEATTKATTQATTQATTTPSTTLPGAASVVCNPPYIYFSDTCCLDINENKICDSDEGGTEVTTAATSATTVATSEATTMITLAEATTTEATTAVTTEATTSATPISTVVITTLGATTLPTVPTLCSDTDGGKSYYEKGTTHGFVGMSLASRTDWCDGDAVVEYYCSGNFVSSVSQDCLLGCDDGACNSIGLGGMITTFYVPTMVSVPKTFTSSIITSPTFGVTTKAVTSFSVTSFHVVTTFFKVPTTFPMELPDMGGLPGF